VSPSWLSSSAKQLQNSRFEFFTLSEHMPGGGGGGAASGLHTMWAFTLAAAIQQAVKGGWIRVLFCSCCGKGRAVLQRSMWAPRVRGYG
jgi:hypothetical protein